ncbi:MAG: hypothetical protein HY234_01785 [Acidobacteria bacterium]|nr:hypothetical protein [Acidobacteriota bacterium]
MDAKPRAVSQVPMGLSAAAGRPKAGEPQMVEEQRTAAERPKTAGPQTVEEQRTAAGPQMLGQQRKAAGPSALRACGVREPPARRWADGPEEVEERADELPATQSQRTRVALDAELAAWRRGLRLE